MKTQEETSTPSVVNETVEFRHFKQAVQRRFNEMKTGVIYRARIEKDYIWELYLDSFPEGTNPMFRERTEHDCSCCKTFVKNAGPMVSIVDGEIKSIWNVQVGGFYQKVADALAQYVESQPIENLFIHSEPRIGIDKNYENLVEVVNTYEHFHVVLDSRTHQPGTLIGPLEAEYRARHDVFLRSLQEITIDSVETLLDLIAQNGLYRGQEKKSILEAFLKLKRQFDTLRTSQDLFAWSHVFEQQAFVCKIRNDVIGTLLVDISEGKNYEEAVKSYEDKVSGTNYKRPTSLITTKMRDQAKQKLEELGLIPSLGRRYAKLEDIRVTNVLFADRSAKKRLSGDVFDSINTKGSTPKNFDTITEISIDDFIQNVLPTAESLEILFENKFKSNLVSLIAPEDLTSKTLFKWGNPFSWSYNGDVADSIKEKVKNAGGNVVGDVCCRLAWYNYDDLDFHMIEPDQNLIYYVCKDSRTSGGRLDVDMNALGGTTREPVENIFYKDCKRMQAGRYQLMVNQYCKRDTKDPGFEVEIDVLGTTHHFSYPDSVPQSRTITVAEIHVSHDGKISVHPVLESRSKSKKLWNVETEKFQKVSAVMLSPNFWDGNTAGNKHYMFMIDVCQNDGSARGFYNEFLKSDLEPHRKTMEIVGSKMRTDLTEDQMSGLGFSSTKPNSIVCKVHGTFTRTMKIKF